jgi:hypothetical protein
MVIPHEAGEARLSVETMRTALAGALDRHRNTTGRRTKLVSTIRSC